MAKINLKDKQFTTIDGRILNIEEYFTEKDFVSDDNGQGNFIKHDALMRVCKKLFSIVGRSVNIIRAPSAANGMCAAATVTYILFAKEINSGEIGTQHFSFTSSGDCNPQNAPSFPADRYMTAMADIIDSAFLLIGSSSIYSFAFPAISSFVQKSTPKRKRRALPLALVSAIAVI